MSETIRDILVVSDMDGTLLASDCTIPACNLETIRLFTALGGKFTVATGRTVASVAMYPQLAGLLAPGITNGGCVLYDFQNKKPLKSVILPHLAARQALRDVLYKFPAVGAMVMAADMRLYQVHPSPMLDVLIHDEKMNFFHRPYDDLPDEWNKLLFAGEPQALEELARYVATRTYPGLYFLHTNTCYFEAMPKGASKASALRDLCGLLGVPLKNTYVIGDYYNDIDVMKQAGHAVAVDNAPREVKLAAQEATLSNNEGGVGQFLYRLIKQYEDA